MKNLKPLLLATALFLCTALHAEDVRVLLLNAWRTDVEVEAKDKRVRAEIAPGRAATVPFTQPQWLKLGQEVFRFETQSIYRLWEMGQKEIVLQLSEDGKLYLMPSGTKAVQPQVPQQPRGFPLKSTQRIDLT